MSPIPRSFLLTTHIRRLAIIQPYVPRYRLEFFQRLFDSLHHSQIDMTVLSSPPTGEMAARGDSAGLTPWIHTYDLRNLALGRRQLSLSSAFSDWKRADAVIAPAQGSHFGTWRALWRRDGRRVGLWGHIDNYVSPAHPVDVRLEQWQLRHADHVFAYTPTGSAFAIRQGAESSRVTTVMNTFDTTELTQHLASIAQKEHQAWLSTHAIAPGPAVAYLGALDSTKRIDFLRDALDELWRRRPDVQVLVAGRGSQERLLDRAAGRGQVKLLGTADSRAKAHMSLRSAALISAGRIGLVAVDALAMRLPLIAAPFDFSAPESEYLVEGRDVFTTGPSVADFTDTVIATADQGVTAFGDRMPSPFPSIDEMVSNFAKGVVKMFEAPPNTRRYRSGR